LGHTTLLLVVSPTSHQGGTLLAVLPWLLLAAGVILTATAAALVERLLRGRDQAERLADENADLYDQQHRVAYTLQHSLLPESLPDVEGAELAVRYTPGVDGMEIGGDWYDALVIDEHRLALVVGDVSGRGLRAASVMASLRYAAGAFASQGDDPAVILAKLNDLTEPHRDGHFATVVCVLVDLKERTATAASAGHPRPILLNGDTGRFIDTTPGRPIGVRPEATYVPVNVPLPASGTLLLFTDGLFERRSESIDVGLERLRRAAAHADGDLGNLLDTITADLASDGGHDDVAILALRWPS
jgi:serine phosphatase RsbU (regulator of sigma subunit)